MDTDVSSTLRQHRVRNICERSLGLDQVGSILNNGHYNLILPQKTILTAEIASHIVYLALTTNYFATPVCGIKRQESKVE